MAKSIASTSVQDLTQQGLSPKGTREKAPMYRAADKMLWGRPEYCFPHFYTSESSTSKSDITPIATIGPVRVQPSMPKLSTIREVTNHRVEEQLCEIDNRETALCGDCGVDDTSRIIYYIHRLTSTQCQVILTRYRYGLTNDQVAARYGISVCTVSGHISTACKSISTMHKEWKEWRLRLNVSVPTWYVPFSAILVIRISAMNRGWLTGASMLSSLIQKMGLLPTQSSIRRNRIRTSSNLYGRKV